MPHDDFAYNERESIRENALRALVVLLEGQRQGQPESDPYDFTWDVVRRTPLTTGDRAKRHACAILQRESRPDLEIQPRIVTLGLELEFSVRLDGAEEPDTIYDQVLTNTQRRIRSDPRLSGTRNNTYPIIVVGPALVINIDAAGDAPDVDGWGDREIGGTIFLRVRWREAHDDPRKSVPQG